MPIFTLFLGMLFIPLAESFKENFRLNKLKRYIFTNLHLLQEQIEKQSTEIAEKLENVEDFNKNDFIPSKILIPALNNILKTDDSDIFKILVYERKGKKEELSSDYKDIISSLNHFSESIPLIFEACQKAAADINMFSDDWNKSQMRFQSSINEFITLNIKNRIDTNYDDFLKQIIFLKEDLEKKYGTDYPNIEISYLEFLRPIIELSKSFSGDHRAFILLNESQQSRLAYEQLKATRKRIKNYLEVANRNLIESNNKFKKAITRLK